MQSQGRKSPSRRPAPSFDRRLLLRLLPAILAIAGTLSGPAAVAAKPEESPSLRFRPQEPRKPYPYVEEQVAFDGKQPGVRLAGTLTLPKGKKPFPAVLLVSGSGPQDRNETLLGHRPFLVLADYLTRRGIAVLRVDDRGVGGSVGASANDTSESYAGDALAGVEFLAQRSDIDAGRIGIVGHSEGGLIAPMVAVKSRDVAYIVLMGAPGVKGEELLEEQTVLVAKARGDSEETIALTRDTQKKMFALLRQGKDYIATEKELRAIWGEAKTKMSSDNIRALGDPDAVARSQIKAVMSPWFRFFLTYDPSEALRQVRCPVLAVNGELDLQVPAKQNLPAIEAALKAGRNPDFSVQELPHLNHLLQTAKTGSPSEYGTIEETLSPVALDVMGNWIVAHASNRS